MTNSWICGEDGPEQFPLSDAAFKELRKRLADAEQRPVPRIDYSEAAESLSQRLSERVDAIATIAAVKTRRQRTAQVFQALTIGALAMSGGALILASQLGRRERRIARARGAGVGPLGGRPQG